MFEKVNPNHPDKIADRIAGAIVDLAYSQKKDPKIAVEVLIGHGECNVTIECDADLEIDEDNVKPIVTRIVGRDIMLNLNRDYQDHHLANNQRKEFRCGDNGIFRGCPITAEQKSLTLLAKMIYDNYDSDGKYILDEARRKLIVCQSKAGDELKNQLDLACEFAGKEYEVIVNPLGPWLGGINVDTGATNRKLGSDMGDAVTGGGLHGKDLSKADVTINIYLHMMAQHSGHAHEQICAIGDEKVGKRKFSKMMKRVKKYIDEIGGFEALAEWGLIRPE